MKGFDSHGRRINYLRLSVTDRCNMRCSYCMPPEGVPQVRHGDILSYEDLLRIARAAVAVGVEKIRVTGGEPLVRKGIVGFLREVGAIPGLKRLVLTTNGAMLGEMSGDLREAGVQSLNISLDSLRPEVFARVTRCGDLQQVLRGIEAAEQAGFRELKINMVVMRGVNDDEIADFAAMTLHKPYRVRFIEFMPAARTEDWESLLVPGSEILERIVARYPLEREGAEEMSGPASYYRIPGGAGLVGVITPVTCHFCGECNRIRVTSTGVARSCLFEDVKTDLVPVLALNDEEALRDALCGVIRAKPERHSLGTGGSEHKPFSMSRIGG